MGFWHKKADRLHASFDRVTPLESIHLITNPPKAAISFGWKPLSLVKRLCLWLRSAVLLN